MEDFPTIYDYLLKIILIGMYAIYFKEQLSPFNLHVFI